jgi:signal transduction histidine kinase
MTDQTSQNRESDELRARRGERIGSIAATPSTCRGNGQKSLPPDFPDLVLQLQEEERRRIGRELHDSTAQSLAALEMNLALLARHAEDLNSRGQQLLEESADLARQCSQEVRTLSYLLHPPLLKEFGLAACLEWYVKGFTQRSGITVKLLIGQGITHLAPAKELALLRVVQECLTNIHRHSRSSTAAIRLEHTADVIRLEIRDHGNGMIDHDLPRHGAQPVLGVGLAGMRERVRQLKGNLHLTSDHCGTVVSVTLPAQGVSGVE